MPRGSRGWTLLELVIVLIIAAVLAFFAVRTYAPQEANALQQAERLRNDLRHVQMLALTLNKSLQFKMDTPPGACATATYWVIDCTVAALDPCTGAPNTPITDPATGKAFCVVFEPGLSLAGGNMHFDPLGRPKSGAALIAGSTTLTISGGGPGRTVVVAPVTGFATAQ